MKQIIAIGGGGFSHRSSDLNLERFILSQTITPSPKICFLPQASSEDKTYVVKFYEAFSKLGATPTWLSLFDRVESSWSEKLLSQDIIYVGGGNTKSMLALWRDWGVDCVLKQAYEKGVILCGVSAGALCWFEDCVTDSVWPLGSINGLGFLPGSACPHYDSEPERPEAFSRFVRSGTCRPGIALDDFTAAQYINGKLNQVVSTKLGQSARFVDSDGIHPIEVTFYPKDLS